MENFFNEVSTKDIDSEFAEILNRHFYDMLDEDCEKSKNIIMENNDELVICEQFEKNAAKYNSDKENLKERFIEVCKELSHK